MPSKRPDEASDDDSSIYLGDQEMRNKFQRGFLLFTASTVGIFFTACGGTASNSHQNLLQSPPAVAQLAITTASLPNGTQGQPYTVTLQASGGTGADTWSIMGGSTLPDDLSLNPTTGVISGIPATVVPNRPLYVQVKDSSPTPQVIVQQFTFAILPAPLTIATSVLPPATVNQPYAVTLATGGGSGNFNWSLVSGALPPGLELRTDGHITGAATTTGLFNFVVRVDDATPASATRALSLQIVPSGVRNDTLATATPISDGIIRASISPYGDSSGGTDTDYYRVTAAPGAVVKIEFLPVFNSPFSPLVEIIDASGTRLAQCSALSGGPFSASCISDVAETGVLPNARLFLQAPAGSTPSTFFLHVLDWRGDARPDMLYDLKISYAN
jgi:hypothetical protein